MKRRTRIALAVSAIVLATIACGSDGPRELVLYPTQTLIATQTPLWVQITTTPVLVVVEITQTPNTSRLCVNAAVAVYLRPTPSDQNYPITEIRNGAELVDLGSRNGKWMFVQLGDNQGWVHGDYVGACK